MWALHVDDAGEDDVEAIYFDVSAIRSQWFHVLDQPPRYLTFRLEWNLWEPERTPVNVNGNYAYADLTIDINNITPTDIFPVYPFNPPYDKQVIASPPWLFKIGMYILANGQLSTYTNNPGSSQLLGLYYSNLIGSRSSPTVIPVDWFASNIVGQNPTPELPAGLFGDMYTEPQEDPNNAGHAGWIDGLTFYFCSSDYQALDVEGYFLTQELVPQFAPVHPFSNVVVLSNMVYADAPYKIGLLYYYTFEQDSVDLTMPYQVENCIPLRFDARIQSADNIQSSSPVVGQQYLHTDASIGPLRIDPAYNTFTPTQGGWTFAFWFRLDAVPATSGALAPLILLKTPNDGGIHSLNIAPGTQTIYWSSSTAPLPPKPVRYDPRNKNMSYLPLNQWMHIAMTFDTTTNLFAWFLNGNKEYTQTQIPFPVGQPIQFVGMGSNFLLPPTVLNADFDEIRVYDGALSPEDIYSLAHYNLRSNPLLSVPYPPRNSRASNPSLTTIDLVWDAPLYSTTEDLRNIVYTVVAEPSNQGQTTQDYPLIVNGISNPHYTMTNLRPTTAYFFRIFATNQVGQSLPSTLSNVVPTHIQSLGGFDQPITIATGNGLLNPPRMSMPIFSNNAAVYYPPNTTYTGISTVSNVRAKRLRC